MTESLRNGQHAGLIAVEEVSRTIKASRDSAPVPDGVGRNRVQVKMTEQENDSIRQC